MATVFLQITSKAYATGECEEIFPEYPLNVWVKIENDALPKEVKIGARGILELEVQGPETPQRLFTISWRFKYRVKNYKHLGKIMVGTAGILDDNLAELKKFRKDHITNLRNTNSFVEADKEIVSLIVGSMKREGWAIERSMEDKNLLKWLDQQLITS